MSDVVAKKVDSALAAGLTVKKFGPFDAVVVSVSDQLQTMKFGDG